MILQIERLRHQLSLVQRNEAFLLHAGDCAESFDACTNVDVFDYSILISILNVDNGLGKYLCQNRAYSLVLLNPRVGSSSSYCTLTFTFSIAWLNTFWTGAHWSYRRAVCETTQ